MSHKITPSAPPEEATTELNTIIVLPDGRIAVRKPLAAWVFFDYQYKLAKHGSEEADAWLYMQSYSINGVDLTRDDIDTLSFDDRARLDTGATSIDATATPNDDRELDESDDFTLADGRRITRLKLAGNKYATFKRKAAEDSSKAFLWVIQQMFRINDSPIDEDMLTNPAPLGLGFDAAALLTNRVAALFRVPQALKTSLQSARLLDGD